MYFDSFYVKNELQKKKRQNLHYSIQVVLEFIEKKYEIPLFPRPNIFPGFLPPALNFSQMHCESC